jgi:hypothetical protein
MKGSDLTGIPTGQFIPTAGGTVSNSNWQSFALNPNGNITMDTSISHTIQGKMLVYKTEFDDYIVHSHLTEKDLKERLMLGMVREILSANCVEFTKMYDPIHNKHTYHARIFVVPDSNVRILREIKY